MRNRLRLSLSSLSVLEAALVGVFFVSAARFLIGMVYSRFGGASIALNLDQTLIPAGTPGVVDSTTISNEISFLAYMLALPLITLILGRFRWLSVVAVVLVALGRVLMVANSGVTPLIAASMTFGGGLIYITTLVRNRAQALPYMFIIGLGIDQILRAYGNTLDPSWSPSYINVQLILSAVAVILSIITFIGQQRQARSQESAVTPDYGLMPFWGGIGLGGLLFLQLSLLAVPNAVAGRTGIDYTNFAPFITLATMLPLIPAVRSQASSFVGLFDRTARGWAWMLLLALLIVFGTRFRGVAAGVALVIAQFLASMVWWWLVRPRAEKERLFTGLWVIFAVAIFMLLSSADNFTYEYAYVQNMPPDFAFLDPIVPPFLRAFRGMGLGVLLLSVFFAVLPMVQTQRRIPWTTGGSRQSVFALIVVAAFSGMVALAVRPPQIAGVQNQDAIRVGTYNIHAGFNEFYNYDLEAIARTIQRSGANVVLLQQVENGRLSSFGVDQPLWLARRLGMDTRFFATNEGLQGLAVLSNVPIVFDDGLLLTSIGNQTGIQRVQIRPDDGIITLYNTRLEYLLETGDGRSIEEQEQEQQRQLNEIVSVLANQFPDGNPGRLMMGGTFNNVPDSDLAAKVRQLGFRDPFAGAPVEPSATFWRIGYPHVRLDYLWILKPLSECGAGVMDTNASDHRMATVSVLIKSGGNCPS